MRISLNEAPDVHSVSIYDSYSSGKSSVVSAELMDLKNMELRVRASTYCSKSRRSSSFAALIGRKSDPISGESNAWRFCALLTKDFVYMGALDRTGIAVDLNFSANGPTRGVICSVNSACIRRRG